MKLIVAHIRIIGAGLAAFLMCQAVPASAQTLAARTAAGAGTPVNVIFDTDMWSDIDDALALAMLHALHDRGEANLVAVTVSTDDRWCAPYVDLVNTFYGHGNIPIGVVRDGIDIAAFQKKFPAQRWPSTRFTQFIAERKNSDGSWVYPRRLTDGSEAPEAVGLLRKTLAAQPDGSVLMVQVGYSTNLARLLDSKADAASSLDGRDLIRKKVRLLSAMAGNFRHLAAADRTGPASQARPEFNLKVDVPSAQRLFSEWPTPIVISGYEIGAALLYPRKSIEHDYAYVANHPIADTYRYFCTEQKLPACPHEHRTYDLTSVLHGARPEHDYFSLSTPGKVTVLEDGSVGFQQSADGPHRYLLLSEEQKARAREAMAMLASQPPVHINHAER